MANHLREVIENIESRKLLTNHKLTADKFHFGIGLFSRLCENAACFDLGEMSALENLTVIPELSRLPYETCWFEFQVNEFTGGCLLTDIEKFQHSIMFFKNRDRVWRMFGVVKTIPMHEWAAPIHEWNDETITQVDLGEAGNPVINKSHFLTRRFIQAFLSALHCINVKRIAHYVSPALAKKRERSGKKPLFSYWTLELDIAVGSISNPGNSCGHSSPRLHLRRGHPRRYMPGKWCWVQPHVVGNKKLGMVHKDYSRSALPTPDRNGGNDVNTPTPLGVEIDRLRLDLAAAFELKRRAEQPDSAPDFKRMPTYVKKLHAELFAALPTPDSPLPTPDKEVTT